MKPLPDSDNAIVLRTDFSDQAAWDEIRTAIRRPVDGFYASVTFVDDPAYTALTKPQLYELFESANQRFVIVADQKAISDPEHPLLIVDLRDEDAHAFRAIPSQIQSIENNLSISNMDFEEFANAAADDGVFRGFPRY